MLRQFAKILTLLLFAAEAQAADDRTIIIQPRWAVVAACGDAIEHHWGCVTFAPATNNPAYIFCYMHVPNDIPDIEQGAAINRLRPQCSGG